jgi:hypothetical protein
MKAHRRNGIPTLMLQDGGGSLISRLFKQTQHREKPENSSVGFKVILLAKPAPYEILIYKATNY